ncbi:EAL and GGDEF domain-containing protein [Pseudoalteromonas sp. SR44-5]|uniref:GGDEF domain-containing protein n=1 Tax=unclassified Pseudoalteromonas TaxID=194690 RepID=UPI0016007818|nr:MULTISPECIES: bifunctional diguanylate cyclase/phosphodiesterase [unclassified Pseudoalteromonas]MBB1368334.1 EAL and GGDEF domain-containing protein [Pseudoalteromonas sp. SR44-5]MBB1436910.1 EAL and GGDEF domain-containing protein [Pseudoalteromonas sp. SG43-6]MBB1481642.1 EAL and GGDEF domain-containing protein [Pseudoalteromonas sp. SG41-2]
MSAQLSILDNILRNSEITTLFQPIFDIAGQQILGYEALSRGPKNCALEMPNTLFSAAIVHDKISELELLCRSKAIENFVRLKLQGKLFLNVSPKTLLDPCHPKGETLHLIKQFGLAANRVVIEVTEQEKVDDGFLLLKTIAHYRQLGFSIAIDDLGAGYSGLKQWSELCPDYVKIDRYFIDHCDESVVKKEFLKSIIELAKVTKTAVIAEGIERVEELSLLEGLGIVNAQGFLLERPSLKPSLAFDSAQLQQLSFTPLTNQFEQSMAIGWLAIEQASIDSHTRCKDAHNIFEKDKSIISLAVVDENLQPIGLLHKDQLTEVFAAPYGHALYDKQPVTALMHKQPLVVDENQLLDTVSQQITENDFDIRRHIVITRTEQYLGLAPLRDILKHITEEKIRHAQHANPLTMLPGNVAINEAIEHRLRAKHSFALAYIDLNHFKQFNDLYGYASGDSVIKLLADVTTQACSNVPSFVGHIGGDDFMVVFDGDDAATVCNNIITEFELKSRAFFTPEHIASGGYWATNREGEKQFVPLLTLSIGVVEPDLEQCTNSHQIAALATDAKKEAKRYRQSYLFLCKRRGPALAVVRLTPEKQVI